LVKDRVRRKDAPQVLATSAMPSPLLLGAPTRQRLLDAAAPCAADQVAAEQAHARAMRAATVDLRDAERLLQRVTHLRQIVSWAAQVAADGGAVPHAAPPARRACAAALALAPASSPSGTPPRAATRW
jgi:hypothetical protein